uniref:Carboxylic ester hydrolase n=1 Tax=Meteorus pulchricornis TaxID=51522 RepID=A0A4D6J625_9HYME|nr:carboxylesterase 17 [Meteorus pulchricornis]
MNHYLWLISLFICIRAVSNEPIVRTKFGPIRGKQMTTKRGFTVAAYLGIPYAEPPVGQLRFKNTQPWKQRWMNVHNTMNDGSICPQLNGNMEVIGDEDCLYLNIFVPQISAKKGLPVLVFIHGGAFISGSNNSTLYAPDYLLDQGIILVTVNYRLGILGFLSSGNEASPGNYGLKDVIEALFWIQANIEEFGGNASLITLAGHSAGASIAHHLALSNRTENLFDKVITHSGSANAPWAVHTPKSMKMRYITVAIELGCANNRKIMEINDPNNESNMDRESIVEDDKTIVECLRTKSPGEITKMLNYFHLWRGKYPQVNFGPTIEPEAEGAIITKHPMVAIENNEFRDIPWLSGVVNDEGYLESISMILNSELRDEFKEEFEDVVSFALEQEEIIGNHSEYVTQLENFYFPISSVSEYNLKSFMENVTMMMTDALITYWSYEALSAQSSMMNSSAFFFEFSYDGTFSGTFAYGTTVHFGITHGDDMNYLFPIYNKEFEDLDLHNTLDDITMINIMTEIWGNFIKTGIPSAQLSPQWRPYQEDFRFMRLGMGRSPDILMENDFHPMRMEFWNNLMKSVGAPRDIIFPQTIEENGNDDDTPNQLMKNATMSDDATQVTLFDKRIILILIIGYYIF